MKARPTLALRMRTLLVGLLLIVLVAPMNVNNPKKDPLMFDFDLAQGTDQDLKLQTGLRQKLEEEMLQNGFEQDEISSLSFNELLKLLRPEEEKEMNSDKNKRAPKFIQEFLKFVSVHRPSSAYAKLPRVGIEDEVDYTLEDYIVFIAAIADGLNWEEDYNRSIECVYDFAELGIRLEDARAEIENITNENGRNPLLFGDVIKKSEMYELALALGNISSTYKDCWDNAEASILEGAEWAYQFPSFQTYILYLLPNLLAQAVVLNKYLDRIRAYEEDGNQTGVYYVYALIFRKIYIYNIPEYEDDLDYYYPEDTASARAARNVEEGLVKLFTPNIDVKFSSDQNDSQYWEPIPEDTFSLRQWFKSFFVSEEGEEKERKTLSDMRAERQEKKIEKAKKLKEEEKDLFEMSYDQAPRAVLSYQQTTLERLGNFLTILNDNIEVRSYSVYMTLAGWLGMEVDVKSGSENVVLEIDLDDKMLPDIQIKKSKQNYTSIQEPHHGFINKTMSDHPEVEQIYDSEIPLISDQYNHWFHYTKFAYFSWLYFSITMTEHPPVNEFDVNMIEGCHNGWFGQYLSAILLWNLFQIWQSDELGVSKVKFFQRSSFAVLTPLEYLYPQMAYCEAAPGQMQETWFDVKSIVKNDKKQIYYNILRKLGTISHSFMTFWGCFYTLDGRCAGIRSGRFLYHILDYRNFFEFDDLADYITQYQIEENYLDTSIITEDDEDTDEEEVEEDLEDETE